MHIVFDIGGTKMRLGSSRDGETLDKTIIFNTPKTYEEGIEEFKRNVAILVAGEPVDSIAGGLAGAFSQKNRALVSSPNLSNWVGRPISTELETYFNAPVYIENDAALAGLGEAVRGAGMGHEIVAYMTVSTGVGGSRIVQGKIDTKTISFEPGHQIIDSDMTVLPGVTGVYFEDYVSGHGFTDRTKKSPKEMTDPAFWDSMAKILAVGLNNLCVFWSPSVIVLGGSMITGDPAISIDKTREYLKSLVKIYPELPEIKISELGDLCGLHGALEYLKQMKEIASRLPLPDPFDFMDR